MLSAPSLSRPAGRGLDIGGDRPGGIKFNRTFADLMALFRDISLVVDNFLELYAPDKTNGDRFSILDESARKYPSEQV